jgi:gluconokinase
VNDPVVLVMGVSGCGKSTVGGLLAQLTGWPFLDADTLHTPANVAKMRSGHPLSDEDRWPWLERVAAWIGEHATAGAPGVVACSALKRGYRDRLRRDDAGLRTVFLTGPRELLLQRLAERDGHFFPESLLDTQLAVLEPPAPEEHPIVVQIGQSSADVVDAILSALGHTNTAG